MEAIPRNFIADDWITIVLLGVFIILAIIRANDIESFDNFIKILISGKFFRERKKTTYTLGFFTKSLFLVQALIVSLTLFYILNSLKIVEEKTHILFLQILLIYIVFVVGKYLIEKMLGVLFSLEKQLDEYIFFKITYKNFLSLVLLPFLIIITYVWGGNSLFFSVLAVLFLVVNLLFLLYFFHKNQKFISQNFYYFILYLCAFEIAPYFIIYKIVE